MTDRNTPSPDDRELIEELRREAAYCSSIAGVHHEAISQAADRLESLLADRAKLEEALRTIADLADSIEYGGHIEDIARAVLNRSADRG